MQNWEGEQLNKFMANRCVIEDAAQVASSDLYAGYLSWATTERAFVLSQSKLGQRLAANGFQKARGRDGSRIWIGIRVRETPVCETPA